MQKRAFDNEKLEMKTETTTFFDLMDKYFGTLCLIIISLSLSVYIGWMWDSNKIIGEIEHGYPGFTKPLIAGITTSVTSRSSSPRCPCISAIASAPFGARRTL